MYVTSFYGSSSIYYYFNQTGEYVNNSGLTIPESGLLIYTNAVISSTYAKKNINSMNLSLDGITEIIFKNMNLLPDFQTDLITNSKLFIKSEYTVLIDLGDCAIFNNLVIIDFSDNNKKNPVTVKMCQAQRDKMSGSSIPSNIEIIINGL